MERDLFFVYCIMQVLRIFIAVSIVIVHDMHMHTHIYCIYIHIYIYISIFVYYNTLQHVIHVQMNHSHLSRLQLISLC